jgi:hypothetical protein
MAAATSSSRGAFVTVDYSLGRGARRWPKVADRLQQGLFAGIGPQLAKVIRFGEGSIQSQFQTTTAIGFHGTVPWTRTRDFGRRRAPDRTLQPPGYPPNAPTGELRDAWLGENAYSISVFEPNRVLVGVDTHAKPSLVRAWVFQRTDGPTVSKAIGSHRVAQGRFAGRLKMQVYLGLTYGLWFTEKFLLERGFKNPSRPVLMNPVMLRRLQKLVIQDIFKESGPVTFDTQFGRAQLHGVRRAA